MCGWLFKKKSITMHGNMNVTISKVLRDFGCSLNQSLKSCDDYYYGTLKKYNKTNNYTFCLFKFV